MIQGRSWWSAYPNQPLALPSISPSPLRSFCIFQDDQTLDPSNLALFTELSFCAICYSPSNFNLWI